MTKFNARRFGRSWRQTSRPSVSAGISSRSRATVRKSDSQAKPSAERANTPTLAVPPLSPERAPTTLPIGARTVGPPGTAAASGSGTAISIAGATTPAPAGRPSTTVTRSSTITVWGQRSAGTAAGQNTPYGLAVAGPPRP